MKLKWLLSSIIFTFFIILLSACGGDKESATNNPRNKTNSTNKNTSKQPAIGTLITNMTGLGSSAEEEHSATNEYRELDWKELAPDTAAEDKILAKYQPQIDKIPEGGKGAQAIYDKMIAEFNALPANPKLDGQKIKIPGYVAVYTTTFK